METLTFPRLVGRAWGVASMLMILAVVISIGGFVIGVAHDVVSAFEQQGNDAAHGSDAAPPRPVLPPQNAPPPRFHFAEHKTHQVARRCTCRRAADFAAQPSYPPLTPSQAAMLAYMQRWQ